MKHILVLLLLILFPISAFAGLNLPNASAYVNDYAGILNNKPLLEKQIIDFEKQTSNEISIITVKTLQGTTIEDYAVRLFAKWKIGKSDKDNGVLILIAPNERKVRIEVGYGLEGVLPDSATSSIIRNEMLPYFKKGDYQTGVGKGLLSVMQATKGEYKQKSKNSAQTYLTLAIITIFKIIFFAVFIVLVLLMLRKRGKSGLIGLLLGTFLGSGFRGGRGSDSASGGFGGFGGGSSGGGGASGDW